MDNETNNNNLLKKVEDGFSVFFSMKKTIKISVGIDEKMNIELIEWKACSEGELDVNTLGEVNKTNIKKKEFELNIKLLEDVNLKEKHKL